MGLSVDVKQRGSPPQEWEARVHEIPVQRRTVEAVFRYARRRKTVVLTEIALTNRGGAPLTSVDLRRRYPLASWEKAARTNVIDLWHESEGEAIQEFRFEAEEPTEERLAERLNKYAAIAAEYRSNLKNGVRDPAGEIARRHRVKPSTARGWVYRARKLGLLREARDRTSGEV